MQSNRVKPRPAPPLVHPIFALRFVFYFILSLMFYLCIMMDGMSYDFAHKMTGFSPVGLEQLQTRRRQNRSDATLTVD